MLHDLTLSRNNVVLRPLRVEDGPLLRSVVDAETWAGMSTPFPGSDEEMSEGLRSLIEMPGVLAFAVEGRGRLVGRTTFYELVPGLRVEIGNTIYDRRVWGSEVNPTAKLLLLGYAFDQLGLGRVALRCDHRNARSHAAIARLGATFEGTLRQFRPAADGSIADVDYFSVLRGEWPDVRSGLEQRVSPAGPDRP